MRLLIVILIPLLAACSDDPAQTRAALKSLGEASIAANRQPHQPVRPVGTTKMKCTQHHWGMQCKPY